MRLIVAIVWLCSLGAWANAPKVIKGQRRYTSCHVEGDRTSTKYPYCNYCLDYNFKCDRVCYWDYSECKVKGQKDGNDIFFRPVTGRTLYAAKRNALSECEKLASNCSIVSCESIYRERSRKQCSPWESY